MLAGEILISEHCLDKGKRLAENGEKTPTERSNTMSTREQIMQLLGSVKTEWALRKILSYIRIVIEKEGEKG